MSDERHPDSADPFEAQASRFFDDVDLFSDAKPAAIERSVEVSSAPMPNGLPSFDDFYRPLDPSDVLPNNDPPAGFAAAHEARVDEAPVDEAEPDEVVIEEASADDALDVEPQLEVALPVSLMDLPAPKDLPQPNEASPAYSSSILDEHAAIKRHRVRRGVLIALGAWAALIVVLLAGGVVSLRNAQAQLESTKAELSLANLDTRATPSAEATADSMGRAHRLFSSPIVAPTKLLPVVGRQIKAVDALALAGERAIRVGIDSRRAALPVAQDPPRSGAERLAALETAQRVARDGNQRLAELDLGPSRNLIGPLANTRSEFVAELNRIGELLQRAETGAAGLATFLKGPSRYAVFAANNAEMRAGSGMYLSAGTLDVRDGELSLGPMQTIYDLPPAPNNVALEYDYLRLWGLQAPGSDYRFVNMTPRFPTSAALLQRMWAASGAPPVDGVLVIDPVAAVELMKLTGEVKVGDKTINASNGLKWFLRDQYLDANSPIKTALRRDALADVVQAIFARLNTGSYEPSALGAALGNAAAGRHLMAWTPTANVQRGWNAAGMDGALPDQSVMFALQNRGGNKLDYFQRISAVADVKVSQKGSRVGMEFLITNTVPNGEPQYIAGPTSGSYVTKPNVYVGFATFNLPANATAVSLTGGGENLVAGPDGNTQVTSTFVELDQDETIKLRLEFTLPVGQRALTVLPSARYPEVFWHIGKTSWYDTQPRVIAW